ncbi:MAG: colicin V production CvpA [Gammaproteobacteria bacterium]|nr:MAG: colicin V production CvpA [Pseudomonadota bacterium]PIE38031.1 MAG: colicin V production CvpA [Gammaproteobacteria bacterium]
MEQLNWADWVLIGIVAISGLISLKRGFVKEALSLVTWVAAFIVARAFSGRLQVLLESYTGTPSIRAVVAFVILFVVTLLVGALVNRLVSELIRISGLSTTDRILGVFFGIGRGIILSVVVIAVLRYTPLPSDPWWHDSLLIERFELIEQWSRKSFGDEFGKLMEKI